MAQTVGIITEHSADNFGSVLQAYALQKVLENYGASVSIINYRPYFITRDYRLLFSIKELRQGLRFGIRKAWRSVVYIKLKNLPKAIARRKKFQRFRKLYLNETCVIKDKTKISEAGTFDIYLAGSDQIWNPEITEGFDEIYFLQFVHKPYRKFSYAASIGTRLSDQQCRELVGYLKDFDEISLRESEYQQLIEKELGRQAYLCLDPTLLLGEDVWNRMCTVADQDDYMLYYALHFTPQQMDAVNFFAQKYHVRVIHFFYGRLSQRLKNAGECFYFDGPEEFLGLVKNARFIITDSYHGTIFSMIFHKQFLTFEHVKWGDRMKNLLEKLKMDDRLVLAGEIDLKQLEMIEESRIDYSQADQILAAEREKSMEYIKKMIKRDAG